ncbi:MAG: hypothetical protein R3F43_22480 [bacterium]
MARLFAEAGQWTEANARFGLAVRTHEELDDPPAARAAPGGVDPRRPRAEGHGATPSIHPGEAGGAIEGRDRRSETVASRLARLTPASWETPPPAATSCGPPWPWTGHQRPRSRPGGRLHGPRHHLSALWPRPPRRAAGGARPHPRGRRGVAALTAGLVPGGLLGGRYRLQAEIGRGGQGAVWRATDAVTGREVAVKRLPEVRRQSPGCSACAERPAPSVGWNIRTSVDFSSSAVTKPGLLRHGGCRVNPSSRSPTSTPPHHRPDGADPRRPGLRPRPRRRARGIWAENVLVHRGADGVYRVKLLDFGFAWVDDDLDDRISLAAKDVFGTPSTWPPASIHAGGRRGARGRPLRRRHHRLGAPVRGSPFGHRRLVADAAGQRCPLAPRSGLIVPPDLATWLTRAPGRDPLERFLSAGQMRRALLALIGHPIPSSTSIPWIPPTPAWQATAIHRSGSPASIAQNLG